MIMKTIAGNPYLKKDQGKFYFDELEYSILEKDFSTPYFVFLENRIKDNINSFNDAFSSHFERYEGFYSFKANYLHEICRIVKEGNFGAEIISLPELELALDLNFSPNKIIVGGIYLTDQLILKCLDNNIKEIIAYSLSDIKRINDLAKNSNKTQKICLRINSGKYNARLGVEINENTIEKLQLILSECKNIELTTILSHFSTQMNSIDLLKKNCISLLTSLKKLQKKLHIDIKNINFGGGFPEAVVFKKERLEDFALSVKKLIQEYNFSHLNVYFEPGRFLVGDAGILISKIINVTDNRWIFLNIGNHIVPKFARCNLRFYNLNNLNESYNTKTSIAGIIPSDQDVLAKDYYFTPTLKIGDRVLISNVGAYCLTFSNRFPYRLPAILLVKSKEYKTIFNPTKHQDFSL